MTLTAKLALIALGLSIGAVLVLIVVNLMPDEPRLTQVFEHVAGASEPAFVQTMEGVVGIPAEAGNRIDTLVNGKEIFPAMLAAIGQAAATVDFETYIYWSGDIAERFADALSAKAKAGVSVNVVLDWVGSLPMDERLIERMRQAGAQVVRFRPLRWYALDRLNNRTHRKILVVDGRIGFVGGVGIADVWQGDARNPGEWRDTHYRLEGPAVAGLQSAFVENWREATGAVLRGERYFPPTPPAGGARAQPIKSSPVSGSAETNLALMLALAAAERHIRIAMAYFVPSEAAVEQLLAARRRGVDVEIIMPGTHNDAAGVREASRHFWGRLLAAGVRIYEFQPTMYHCKLVVVDESWAMIGTANFDDRSLRLNDEVQVNVYDAAFARRQIDLFDRDKARTREVTLAQWQKRPWTRKLSDWLWSHLRSQL